MVALTDKLRSEIGAAGLLTVLMSPHYLRSKWCSDERDWWVECQARHGLVSDGRIAIARIWPTEEAWPKAFLDERGHPLIGFTFYDPHRAETRPQPHDWPDPTGAKGPFREALLDMVGRHMAAPRRDQGTARGAGAAQGRSRASERPQGAGHLSARTPDACRGLGAYRGRSGSARFRRHAVRSADPVERDPSRAREIAAHRVRDPERLRRTAAPWRGRWPRVGCRSRGGRAARPTAGACAF